MTRRDTLRLLPGPALATLAGAAPRPALLVLRVIDALSGRALACTVSIREADGRILTESASYLAGFRSDGRIRKPVSPGPIEILITRGFDYAGFARTVQLREGETFELTIPLARRTPLRRSGWVCGDSHVHMFHGERKVPAGFDYVGLTGRAEALDYLNVAQFWDVAEPTPALLDEACRRISSPELLAGWNMEMPKNYVRGDVSHCLGHGWTLGMRDYDPRGFELIGELTALSASDYEYAKVPIPNFETHALVHSAGGIVSYTHPCRSWIGDWGGRGMYPLEKNKHVSNLAQELPFDTIAGPTYDAIDILMQTGEREVNERGQQLWFLLLNHGYRIAATASSDATFDNPGHGVPGAVRVYTRLDGNLSFAAVARAMKAGRNFVTSGPLVLFSVEGREPGDSLPLSGPRSLRCRIQAWASGHPGEYLSAVELVVNGETVESRPVPGRSVEFSEGFNLPVHGNAWIIARVFGSDRVKQVAITNPVYVEAAPWRQPDRAEASVALSVTDRSTGAGLSGNCEVLEMEGRWPRPLSTVSFQDGRAKLSAPAVARLRVSAPGYNPLTKSIFLDYRPIYETTLNMRVEQLLDWGTFEKMRGFLREVHLDFPLERV